MPRFGMFRNAIRHVLQVNGAFGRLLLAIYERDEVGGAFVCVP